MLCSLKETISAKKKKKLSKRSHVFTYWLTSMPLSDESMKWDEIFSEV